MVKIPESRKKSIIKLFSSQASPPFYFSSPLFTKNGGPFSPFLCFLQLTHPKGRLKGPKSSTIWKGEKKE